jgi:hypothetical protein
MTGVITQAVSAMSLEDCDCATTDESEIKSDTRSDTRPNKQYLIHDNGERPFKIIVYEGGDLSINTSSYCGDDELAYFENVFRYWVGETTPWLASCSFGGVVNGVVGNTFLIQPTSENSYIFVKRTIIEFKTETPIEVFWSPMGNNDVPYPYALSKTHLYFIEEHSQIETKGMAGLLTLFKYGLFSPFKYLYGKRHNVTSEYFDLAKLTKFETLQLAKFETHVTKRLRALQGCNFDAEDDSIST